MRAWIARVIYYFLKDILKEKLEEERRQARRLIEERLGSAVESLQDVMMATIHLATEEVKLSSEQTMTAAIMAHRAQTIDQLGKVTQLLLTVMRQLNNYTTVRAITHQEGLLRATQEFLTSLGGQRQ